jgi:hypothetical protein
MKNAIAFIRYHLHRLNCLHCKANDLADKNSTGISVRVIRIKR